MPATAADYEKYSAWAAIKNPDPNIDRRKCHRVVPFEVINASAPRTGTLSLQEALKVLGYANPYHFSAIFENCRDSDMWLEALHAKYRPSPNRKPYTREDFDQLLGHCGAGGDGPVMNFWKELMEAYPDSKFILVDRDKQKWLDSMRQILEGILNPGATAICIVEPSRAGRILNATTTYLGYWLGTYGSMTVENCMASASRTYDEHYAAVRATVPKERLLEYKMGSGWEPLCKFLGREVPNVPFPHRNDAQTMGNAIGLFYQQAAVAALRNVAIVVGLAAVIGGGVWKLAGGNLSGWVR